jgi:hypothetical protein
MIAASVRSDIRDVAGLLSILLILNSLFTSEQSRVLEAERHRVGGPRRSAVRRTAGISAGLAVVTIVVLVALADLAWRAISGCCGEPVEIVFFVVWLLLVPLACWQVALLIGAARMLRA